MWLFSKHRLPVAPSRTPTLAAIYCRPTRLGAGLVVLVGLLWLVGVNYQVNLAYVAAFWLAGFLVVAILLNFRQLLAFRIDVEMPKEVFAGGTATLELISSHNHRCRWLWLCSEDDFLNPNTAPDKLWHAWHISANTPSVFQWSIPTLMRGYLRVPSLRTASVAPFGLSMVQCIWHWPSDAVVYPAPIAHETPASRTPNEEEKRKSTPIVGGDDLSYLIDHQEGVSLQHIAWKTYAKTGQLLDKRFEEPPAAINNTVISYLDYPAGTAVERLAGLLCYRVLEAEQRGLLYTLELPQRTIVPQKGQREICLTALALW